jgi:hypothetical protein
MKSLDKLNKLADRFEYKLRKNAAGSVDSTDITLAVRPKSNPVIDANAPTLLKNGPGVVMMKKATAALNAEPSVELHGNAKLGGTIFVSATKAGGKWQITSLTVGGSVDGDFTNDKDVLAAMEKAKQALVKALAPALTAEFNRLAPNWGDADKIDNVEVSVNEKSLGI